MFARGDVFAAGVPNRVVQQPVIFFADGTGLVLVQFAIHIHHPNVVAATGVADEGELFAIG
jgi:hypothetical protein